ncbi:UvrD-helicase domain-containing protein [Candidatus Saccharibacteria bacterium]|nr:UvrD-helicase domain-containing protein [Candidatus Saccharibacteria bacterium]MCL1963190.1 UvrD-helicase domain-containing protein [Candidatus Saccharibacteria bacterium]
MNPNTETILEGLNPPQREAVEFGDGPLLILAGAGSGKTKTLTHRIAYLIAVRGVKPWEILAVTFTNKAANEMRERLARILNQENTRGFMPWMGTFHSIAVRILRQYGENIEIPKNFVILDDSDRLSLVKSAMRELGITEKQYNPRSIMSLISGAKNDCLSPAEYAEIAKIPNQRVASDVYRRYERLRREAKSLDFDDLLLEVVKLLKNTKEVRDELSAKLKHVLIDEYQDTNKAQYQIVKLLMNPAKNICAVGDDWQSIYSWRGADFTNILNFERDFLGAKIVKLEQNYRSTEAILDAAHRVITKNLQRTDKELWTAQKGGAPVKIVPAASETHEAEILVQKILSQTDLKIRRNDDFAVLYRTNAQSRVIEEVFLRYGIPYKIVGGTRFYDRAEVKDLLAYLKLIYQPFDRASFMRIVNVPKRGLGDTSVAKFIQWQEASGLSIVDALLGAASIDGITPRVREALLEFGNNLADLAKIATTVPPDELIEKIVSKFDYRAYLNDGTPQAESRLENVAEFIGVAKSYTDLGLVGFLEEVALVSSADQTADSAVTLMTLHAAKGLEFPVVFMVGMETGIFPSARSEYDAFAMEEERRLCYVGMTRAREELILTFAQSRFLYGSRQYNMPSQFLGDIDDTVLGSETVFSTDPSYPKTSYTGQPAEPSLRTNLSVSSGIYVFDSEGKKSVEKNSFRSFASDSNEPRFVPDDLDLAVGDKVSHQIFGTGTVIDIDNTIVTVDFGVGKLKKLNVAFAPLKKV